MASGDLVLQVDGIQVNDVHEAVNVWSLTLVGTTAAPELSSISITMNLGDSDAPRVDRAPVDPNKQYVLKLFEV